MPEKYIRYFSRLGRLRPRGHAKKGTRKNSRVIIQTALECKFEIVIHMKRLTLTFDNGPTPGITEHVLDILAARRIPATFFIVGERLAKPGGRALAARARLEGHWIANHSMTHSVPLGENPDAEYARREIEETQNSIGELAHADKLFRPMGGGGSIGPHLLSRAALRLLQEGRYTCLLWSSVPGDWRDRDGWVDRCLAEVGERDWTVVVLHDVENAALPRLPEFLDRLGSLGIEFRQDFPDDVVITRRGEVVSALASQIVT